MEWKRKLLYILIILEAPEKCGNFRLLCNPRSRNLKQDIEIALQSKKTEYYFLIHGENSKISSKVFLVIQ